MKRELIIPAVLSGITVLMLSIEVLSLLIDPTGAWLDMETGLFTMQMKMHTGFPQFVVDIVDKVPFMFANFRPYALGLLVAVVLPNILGMRLLGSRPIRSLTYLISAGILLIGWMLVDQYLMGAHAMGYVFMGVGALQTLLSAHACRSLLEQYKRR